MKMISATFWYLITIFATTALNFPLYAQDYSFEKYLRSDGLSNNSVRAIYQDSKGYLWLGTLNGLNKYDGVVFHTYYHDYSTRNSLVSNRIYKLQCDSLGNLWILTFDGEALMYDPDKDIFYSLNAIIKPTLEKQKNKKIHIKDIYIRNKEELFFYTRNNGCIKVQVGPKKILSAEMLNINKKPANKKVQFIFTGINNTTWIGSDKGITILNNKTQISLPPYHYKCYCITDSLYLFGTHYNNIIAYNYITNKISDLSWLHFKNNSPVTGIEKSGNDLFISTYGNGFTHYSNHECTTYTTSNTKELYSNIISPIYIDKHQTIWFQTGQRGINQFNIQSHKIKYFPLDAKKRESLGEPEKIIYFEDSNEDLWLGIYGGGLCKFNRHLNTFDQYLNNPNNLNSISSNYVLTLFEDNSKNLWIGTLNGGINRIRLQKQDFEIFQPSSNNDFSTNNDVRSLIRDSNSHIWIGTKSGKLHCFDASLNLLTTIPDDIPSLKEINFKNIYSLMEDHNHNLWVGTKGEGIIVLKGITKNKSMKHIPSVNYLCFKRNAHLQNTLSNNNIYDMLEVNDSTIWVATHSNGLNIIKNPFSNCTFTHYSEHNPEYNTISSDNLRCLFKDVDDNIWIGSADGLNLVLNKDINSDQIHFINFKSQYEEIKSLNNNDIICIYQDSKGTIYCGTYGGGINFLEPSSRKNNNYNWKKITMKQGLSSNVVYKILEDKNNHEIWASTDYGINRINKESNSVKKYFPENTFLQGNTYTENTGICLPDNSILFGQLDGITRFMPDSLTSDTKKYPIYITDVEINQQKFNSGTTDTQHLKYFQNYLAIHFAVLDFGNPHKINYCYKLENYDQQWNYEGNSNIARYKNLAPGNYTFKVKGTNSSGEWNSQIALLKIKILPPWWKTAYAFIAYILITLLIISALCYTILKQLHLKNKLKFEQINTDNKLNFYTNISHEIKTPLSLIMGPAEDILDQKDQPEIAKEKAKEILNNTKRILTLINQLTDFRKAQSGHMNLSVQMVNITLIIEQIHNAFHSLSIKEDIAFNFYSHPAEIIGFIDTDKIEKIVFNLISNAFKHTGKGKIITLQIDQAQDHLKITIEDQGKGMTQHEIDHIFDRFTLFSRAESVFSSSSGLGLAVTKELVMAHKGTITVTSTPGKGSRFTVTVPSNKYSYTPTEIAVQKYQTTDISEDKLKLGQSDILIRKNKRSAGADAATILLIEDNKELNNYLYNNLKSYFNVIPVHNGEDGLEKTLYSKPDLILSDIMLPGINGLELTKKLKTNLKTNHIPIILLTAKSTFKQIQEGFECGADDYITKPFNFSLLKTRVSNLIEQRKKLQHNFKKSNSPTSQKEETFKNKKNDEFLTKLTHLIESNIGNTNFNVESLVKNCNYGRTVLYKKIKNTTGYTPTKFIHITKMQIAAKTLLDSDKSIREISTMIGFNDPDYFCRSFKKLYGTAPSAYRRHREKVIIETPKSNLISVAPKDISQ